MLNRAYDGWNVKSLLFIPAFLFSKDYVRKGVLHDLKEIRSEERIAFGVDCQVKLTHFYV